LAFQQALQPRHSNPVRNFFWRGIFLFKNFLLASFFSVKKVTRENEFDARANYLKHYSSDQQSQHFKTNASLPQQLQKTPFTNPKNNWKN
jgi:hypothetical protein